MSTSDCLPSNCTWEYSALDLPFATLNVRGNPQTIAGYWLFPSGTEKPKWQNFGTIPVVWCPQAFTVTFWHRSGAEQGQVFKLAVWEVTVYGIITSQIRAFATPYNPPIYTSNETLSLSSGNRLRDDTVGPQTQEGGRGDNGEVWFLEDHHMEGGLHCPKPRSAQNMEIVLRHDSAPTSPLRAVTEAIDLPVDIPGDIFFPSSGDKQPNNATGLQDQVSQESDNEENQSSTSIDEEQMETLTINGVTVNVKHWFENNP